MQTFTRQLTRRRFLQAAAAGSALAAAPSLGAAGSQPVPSRYDKMTDEELAAAIRRHPVAFLPAGINEWHGEQSACGLDALKAESLCGMAADLLGGVCFPQTWLGPDGSTPFDPEKYPRGTVTIDKAVYNAAAEELLTRIETMGFRVTVYLSGHYPGVIPEVAEKFNRRGGMKVISISENQVVEGMPAGDHAAMWETAVLMALRPGLVDLSRLPALPPSTRPAGEVIPPPVAFRQRSECYGIYGGDPRVYANLHYGRAGTEAVLDGLAREIRKTLGDDSYARDCRAVQWPAGNVGSPEVRYDHLLPYQWMKRFEQAPIVYVPLPTCRSSESMVGRAVELAREHGGMVYSPLVYGPMRDQRQVQLSTSVFTKIIRELIDDLADMNFRVIVLMPDAQLQADALSDVPTGPVAHGQAEVVVMNTSDDAGFARSFKQARNRVIPAGGTTTPLAGPWTINNERMIAELQDGRYGPSEKATYEHTFEVTAAQAASACLLDLGQVCNHAEVQLNDGLVLTDHWPPYRFIITGMLKAGENKIRVTVTNTPQPTLDPWFHRVAAPRLAGPVSLTFWSRQP